MVLLGFLTDDFATAEQAEMRAIASTWFFECAKHNDVPRILQVFVCSTNKLTNRIFQTLFMMLLPPATARVSIQFVQVENRATSAQLPALPADVNAVALATINGRQTFHHVCRDIDAPRRESAEQRRSAAAPWNDFEYLDVTSADCEWVGELRRHTLASEVVADAPTPAPLANAAVPPATAVSINGNAAENTADEAEKRAISPSLALLRDAAFDEAADEDANFMNASLVAHPRTPFAHSKASNFAFSALNGNVAASSAATAVADSQSSTSPQLNGTTVSRASHPPLPPAVVSALISSSIDPRTPTNRARGHKRTTSNM